MANEEPRTDRPVERRIDMQGADVATLVDMGVLEPPPEPLPPEMLAEPEPPQSPE